MINGVVWGVKLFGFDQAGCKSLICSNLGNSQAWNGQLGVICRSGSRAVGSVAQKRPNSAALAGLKLSLPGECRPTRADFGSGM